MIDSTGRGGRQPHARHTIANQTSFSHSQSLSRLLSLQALLILQCSETEYVLTGIRSWVSGGWAGSVRSVIATLHTHSAVFAAWQTTICQQTLTMYQLTITMY